MSKTNIVLLVVSAIFVALVGFELITFFFPKGTTVAKKTVTQAVPTKAPVVAQSSSAGGQACDLTVAQQESCKKYDNIVREMSNIERDLREKTLNSVTMTYSFTIKVTWIESPCAKNYGGYPLKPDLCIESAPKPESKAQGKTKQETIYKFVDKPNITVYQKKGTAETPIKLSDIKPGDTIAVTSVHDMGKGNKTPFFNYDNVVELKIVKQ